MEMVIQNISKSFTKHVKSDLQKYANCSEKEKNFDVLKKRKYVSKI